MLATRYSPLPYTALRSEFDRLFEQFGNLYSAPVPRRAGFPALNVWEDGQSYFVEAECPGLAMEDLELYVTGDQLTISGTRQKDADEKATFHRRERGTGAFKRVVTLPSELDAANVEATLKNGVLTVKLPKAPSSRPRRIEVRS